MVSKGIYRYVCSPHALYCLNYRNKLCVCKGSYVVGRKSFCRQADRRIFIVEKFSSTAHFVDRAFRRRAFCRQNFVDKVVRRHGTSSTG